MKAAQQQIESPFCALCNAPMDPDTPPGRKVCDGCMGNGMDAQRPPTQICTKCKKALPLTPEYWYRAAQKKNGFQCECKKCHNRVNNAARNAARKLKRKQDEAPTKSVKLSHSIARNADPQWAPNPATVSIDLSSYPDLFSYLTDLSRDQERSLEGQIRWILRQCYKYRTETPSAACGEV